MKTDNNYRPLMRPSLRAHLKGTWRQVRCLCVWGGGGLVLSLEK